MLPFCVLSSSSSSSSASVSEVLQAWRRPRFRAVRSRRARLAELQAGVCILCYTIVLPGRKSIFRAGFRLASSLEVSDRRRNTPKSAQNRSESLCAGPWVPRRVFWAWSPSLGQNLARIRRFPAGSSIFSRVSFSSAKSGWSPYRGGLGKRHPDRPPSGSWAVTSRPRRTINSLEL